MVGGAPLDTTPMSPQARTVERLTMTGPNTLMHELTYSDPATYTAPWTARTEWVRDDGYKFYEYACHEGDEQVRNYIVANRALRAKIASGEIKPEDLQRRRRAAPAGETGPAPRPQAEAAQPRQE